MEIPDCIDNENKKQEEHCWHAGSNAATAPQSLRCCHCGLGFRVQRGPLIKDAECGKHTRYRVCGTYVLVVDPEYRDMYAADPESFDKMAEALEEGRKQAEAARRVWGKRRF